MHNYPDIITVFGITFHRQPQDESHLWDWRYVSEPVQFLRGLPAIITLYVGRREHDEDLAWNGRLDIGDLPIFTDALEYPAPEPTLGKCLARLKDPKTAQDVHAYLEVQARQQQAAAPEPECPAGYAWNGRQCIRERP